MSSPSGDSIARLVAMRTICSVLLTLALSIPLAAQVKDDVKDAGHETAQAGKDVGHAAATGTKKTAKAVKHGVKKTTHAAASTKEKGADKEREKTQYRRVLGRRAPTSKSLCLRLTQTLHLLAQSARLMNAGIATTGTAIRAGRYTGTQPPPARNFGGQFSGNILDRKCSLRIENVRYKEDRFRGCGRSPEGD